MSENQEKKGKTMNEVIGKILGNNDQVGLLNRDINNFNEAIATLEKIMKNIDDEIDNGRKKQSQDLIAFWEEFKTTCEEKCNFLYNESKALV
ncbi:MAG: hypothetical protein FWG79_03505 [Bacteroidales bacterium]|nr:hypothetical protein [Bacteroidales bacterium]